MQEKDLAAWLSLSLTPGITPALFYRLLEDKVTPLEFLENGLPEDREQSPAAGLTKLAANCRKAATSNSGKAKVSQALHWQQSENCHILTLSCPAYPELLKAIPDPPPLLYVRGLLDSLNLPQLALVGSRKPTPGGRALAGSLAAELTKAGYAICSGMALGIDSESHVGAMQSGGCSIAVLGSGVDRLYPKRNAALAEKLLQTGAIVSEFPLGAAPEAWHFPRRNRIISGLSQGVVVIEAALQSGSLITARYALDQGREVFAVPGSPHNRMARGCNFLIKNGARLLEEIDDIHEELGGFLSGKPAYTHAPQDSMLAVSEAAHGLLQHLDGESTSIDALVVRSGIAAENIMALLVELEINKLVIAGPGGYSLSPPGA